MPWHRCWTNEDCVLAKGRNSSLPISRERFSTRGIRDISLLRRHGRSLCRSWRSLTRLCSPRPTRWSAKEAKRHWKIKMLPKRAAIQHYWPASSSAHIAGRKCRPFCIQIGISWLMVVFGKRCRPSTTVISVASICGNVMARLYIWQNG